MPGGSAGLIRPRVYVMDRSPFGGIPRQENSMFVDPSMKAAVDNGDTTALLPNPIAGIRLEEVPVMYDNFLEDGSGFRLHGTDKLDGSGKLLNPEAKSLYDESTLVNDRDRINEEISELTTELSETTSSTERRRIQYQIDSRRSLLETSEKQERFFTWSTGAESLVDRPQRWNYTNISRGGGSGAKREFIAPFFQKTPDDRETTEHWEVNMVTPRPKNQPFQIFYNFKFRESMIGRLPSTGVSGAHNNIIYYESDGTQRRVDVSRMVYLIIELGYGDAPNNNFILFFGFQQAPLLFQRVDLGRPTEGGLGVKPVLVASFDEPSVKERLFTSDQMNIKVESAGGNLYIRNSDFGETPWIITPRDLKRQEGLFIGQRLVMRGGNIQGSFSYAPISYEPEGTAVLPPHGFQKLPDTGDVTISSGSERPRLSVSLKGNGAAVQEMAPDAQDERQMVDAEVVSVEGAETSSSGSTVIDSIGGEAFRVPGLRRRIFVYQEKDISTGSPNPDEFDFNTSVLGGFGGVAGTVSLTRGDAATEKWRPVVFMEVSDVRTPNGWTIPRGRSPYLWLVRQEIDEIIPPDPVRKYELTRDIMSLELNWNTTGIGEISCTGSMKILSSPRDTEQDGQDPPVVENYVDLIDRITYIEIDAELVGGQLAANEVDPSSLDDRVGENLGSRRIFTGCLVSANVMDEPGRQVIDFRIEDYLWVLQAVKFQLCPPYDGMYYNHAVADMVSRTGLPKAKMFADSRPILEANTANMPYLPILDVFNSPKWRFSDGTPIKDAVTKVAKLDWRTIYFDEYGNFHFDNLPQGMFGDKPAEGPHVEFFTGNDGVAWDPAQLVWNNVTRSYEMKDMYNSVQVVTVVKQIPSLLLIWRDINQQSIHDATSPGYIGFLKAFRQKDGALEGPQAAAYFAQLVRLLYNTPKTIRFETYGRIGLRPTQIVLVDGQPWRLINISLRFEAAKNEFWASLEGEWFELTGKSQAADATRPVVEGGGQ